LRRGKSKQPSEISCSKYYRRPNKGFFGTKVPLAAFAFVIRLLQGRVRSQDGVMTTLQAIAFGAMLAWTPSLIVLALLLREVPLDEL
jgi:hypothetical protein